MVAEAWDARVQDQFDTIKRMFEAQPNAVTGQNYTINVVGPGRPGPTTLIV